MIDLSDNTNAWGMPPAAREAIAKFGAAARYPTPYADDLKAAITAYTGFAANMITTGCGSDDVLDCAIRALTTPGERLALTEPTFSMIPVLARLNGLLPVVTPRADLVGSGARIIYLCSPNNPTGTLTPREEIAGLLRRRTNDQVVIVDEAYAEFAGTTVMDLVREFDRLIVTRTMSKAFGLAGLRVGYAIGDPASISAVEKARGPYKVGALSERAAVAALDRDLAWVFESASAACEARDSLTRALRDRGLEPFESAANFVYLPTPNAGMIEKRMRDAGVSIRSFDDPSALRITVGPAPVMDAALAAFDEARRACA